MSTETGGPGWYRMMARLGPAREALRQQVLLEQQAALAEAPKLPVEPRDRQAYTDYPPTTDGAKK